VHDVRLERTSGDDEQALVLDLIHNIEVVQLLIVKNVTSTDHWLWKKQLRFYLNKQSACAAERLRNPYCSQSSAPLPHTGTCTIKMVEAEFNYTYEYQVTGGLARAPGARC
jgi:dynein heavy chain 2